MELSTIYMPIGIFLLGLIVKSATSMVKEISEIKVSLAIFAERITNHEKRLDDLEEK